MSQWVRDTQHKDTVLQDISTGATVTRIRNLWKQKKNGEKKKLVIFSNHHNIEKIQTPESSCKENRKSR